MIKDHSDEVYKDMEVVNHVYRHLGKHINIDDLKKEGRTNSDESFATDLRIGIFYSI